MAEFGYKLIIEGMNLGVGISDYNAEDDQKHLSEVIIQFTIMIKGNEYRK